MADVYEVNLTNDARVELDAVEHYIAQDSPVAAAKFVSNLIAEIRTLTYLPERHRIRIKSKLPAKCVRALIVNPYLIYYRVDDALRVVTVIMVRHGARRQPKRFR